MRLRNAFIQDTFAEAWDLEVVRLAITAMSAEIAMGAAGQFTGAAGSSELGSRVNAGIERPACPQETPDGRPGVFVSLTLTPERRADLHDELALRVVLATLVPTVAIFDAPAAQVTRTAHLDLYGKTAERWQGYDSEQHIGGRSVCVVPTTTGSFLYERRVTVSTEGTDGHIVCYAGGEAAAVMAMLAAKEAIAGVDGVAPMGYGVEQVFRELDYVPALRDRIGDSKVPPETNSILNLLMFGATVDLMKRAMRVAIEAASAVPGVQQIGAMNFGGQFGRHKYVLRELLAQD